VLVRDSSIPKTVKEESVEDEQSVRNDNTMNEDVGGPRSSVASILSAISRNPIDEKSYMGDDDELNKDQKFDDLRQRA